MRIDWRSHLHGRPWVRTLSGGVTQLVGRVLGTVAVAPTLVPTQTFKSWNAISTTFTSWTLSGPFRSYGSPTQTITTWENQ